jgi:site-specific DNA-methyltransferase (adenine-specific)
MATLAPASVDAIVTDPPYGLSFMGKEWDHGVPGVPFWTEALRVAKPGAHLVAFGGTRTHHRLACAIEDAGWEIRDCLMWLHGQGFPKGGAQLKPAWEPITLARKAGPLALNVDGCRIEATKADDYGRSATNSKGTINAHEGFEGKSFKIAERGGEYASPRGRWPANLVLDEEAGSMLDESAPHTGAAGAKDNTGREHGFKGARHSLRDDNWGEPIDERAGAARFFYTSKASSGERHYAGRNVHPCVKPVDLMRWLVRLVTPPGGLVLDPFAGSGSTGVAALAEGMRFFGIELDSEYVATARRRIAGPLFAEASA